MALDKSYQDIPGTIVFDAEMSRKGYHLNQFCMSLLKAENRKRFLANQQAYVDEWPMTELQKKGVLERDLNLCIEQGGNIYFLSKLFYTHEQPFEQAVATMVDMTPKEYREMMLNGGRSIEGNRSKGES
jgi:protocatechuate 4,5-dioxygenase, alpha chain